VPPLVLAPTLCLNRDEQTMNYVGFRYPCGAALPTFTDLQTSSHGFVIRG
jgi:hypothetical protein